MVDFANPTFSPRRARLLPFVPATARLEDGSSDMSEQIAVAITQAPGAAAQGSPERQFAANWQLGDAWRGRFADRLRGYYDAVVARLGTPEGFDAVFRLAESRRQRVRELELSEGRPLLFATSNVPAGERLVMRPDATVAPDRPDERAILNV